MCDVNNTPMSYRYIRRRKAYILLIITCLVVLYMWTDGLDTEYSYTEYSANCKFPCIGRNCLYCQTPHPTTLKIIDIAEHLNLKQALRRNKSNRNQNVSSVEQVCKRPSFDLKHDSLKYGFFKMEPLNCSGEELFYLKDNVFMFNKSQLGDRQLERCKYYGIERESDDYSTFTDSFIKEMEPFDMVLLHDFVRIKCFLKTDKSAENKDINLESDNVNENKSLGNENTHKEYEDIKKNIPDNNNGINNNSNIINFDNNRYSKDVSDVNQMNKDIEKVDRGGNIKDVNNILIMNKDVQKVDRGGDIKNVKNIDVNQMNKDVQKVDRDGNIKDVNNNDVNQMNKDVQKVDRDGNIKDVNNNDVNQMNKDVQKVDRDGNIKNVNNSDVNQMNKDVQKVDRDGNIKDVNNNDVNQMNKDVQKVDRDGNIKNVNNSDVNQMNKDIQKVYRGRSLKADKDYDSTDAPDKADSNDMDGWDDNLSDNWNDDWNGDFDAAFFGFEEKPDFDQLFVQVVPKSEVFQRIDSMRNSRVKHVKLNVLMFGVDSMSHMSYQRKLPKTYKYLKEVLGAVIMDGYNIVGDATTAALIPMLTGKTEMELPETRKNHVDSEFVNVYPLVWNKFREKGYVTMFAEDEPTLSAFNLRLTGFTDPPTDHYMRPFWQGLWETEMRRDSPRFCTGNVPNHMHLINYMKDFFVKYDNVSKFAFMFGSELTHADNNPGEYMDEDFVELLTFLKSNGHLDNTVLFVFGDHGARYTKVRKTVQGKMEERLPMMSITFPKLFQKKHPILYKNLVGNSDRLTTPFDIHETLLDILDLRSVKSQPQRHQRGISWLRPVPLDRTCSDAGIQVHWCTCLKQLDLDGRDKHVQKSISALLKFINRETKQLRHFCAELKLIRLHSAYLLIPNEKVLMFQESSDEDNRVANFTSTINVDHVHFQVTIETSPNQGLYEGTVQANMTSGLYTVIGTEISRLDIYGSQPDCVQEKYPDLRKYCYCKKHDSNKKMDVNIP